MDPSQLNLINPFITYLSRWPLQISGGPGSDVWWNSKVGLECGRWRAGFLRKHLDCFHAYTLQKLQYMVSILYYTYLHLHSNNKKRLTMCKEITPGRFGVTKGRQTTKEEKTNLSHFLPLLSLWFGWSPAARHHRGLAAKTSQQDSRLLSVIGKKY